MGKGKMMVCVGLLAMLFFGLAAPASAQNQWFYCTVSLAGPGGEESTFIRLSDTEASPAFTDKWFELPVSRAKEMLAVALTAMANEIQVAAYVNPAAGETPVIVNLYLYRP